MTDLCTIFANRRTGQVSIMTPAPKARHPAETMESWLSRIEIRYNQYTEKEKVDRVASVEASFPSRGTRDSWRLDQATGKVVVNMQIAYNLRKQRLAAEWRHWKKTVDDTLEFAQGFGDQAAIQMLTKEKTQMNGIPALIRMELDRILADGDEAAMGSWEPDWPTLT